MPRNLGASGQILMSRAVKLSTCCQLWSLSSKGSLTRAGCQRRWTWSWQLKAWKGLWPLGFYGNHSHRCWICKIHGLGKCISGFLQWVECVALGKGQEKLPQSAQAPHTHPPSEKIKILEPQAAMVLQSRRFCRTLQQIGAFSFHGC